MLSLGQTALTTFPDNESPFAHVGLHLMGEASRSDGGREIKTAPDRIVRPRTPAGISQRSYITPPEEAYRKVPKGCIVYREGLFRTFLPVS